MQRAGIDLWSTSNFVLDTLQASPQQFLMPQLLCYAPTTLFFSTCKMLAK